MGSLIFSLKTNLQIETYSPINLIIVDSWDKKEHLIN